MSHEFKRVKGHFHLGDKGLSAEGLRHRDRLDRMVGNLIMGHGGGLNHMTIGEVVEKADTILGAVDEYLKL